MSMGADRAGGRYTGERRFRLPTPGPRYNEFTQATSRDWRRRSNRVDKGTRTASVVRVMDYLHRTMADIREKLEQTRQHAAALKETDKGKKRGES